MTTKLTQADIERLKELYEKGPGHMQDQFLHEFLVKAPALLEAAEWAIKAEKFFREMQQGDDAAKGLDGIDCATYCRIFNLCEIEKELCRIITDTAKTAGLLEGEQEQPVRICSACSYQGDPPDYRCLADFDCDRKKEQPK